MLWKLFMFAVLAASMCGNAGAVCNQCKNGHACVSQTEFQLCFNGEADTRTTYSCPNSGDVCTPYDPICMSAENGAVPACRGLQNCLCEGMDEGYFACTSRTTFTMCHNESYSETTGTCKQGQLCDVHMARDGQLPCTNKCIDETLDDSSICDFEFPVDIVNPTATATPTGSTPTVTVPSSTDTTTIVSPTPPQTSANAVCATQTISKRYPYPNDTNCLRYVFCYWDGDVLMGRETFCPTGRYFNAATGNCQVTKPAGCV